MSPAPGGLPIPDHFDPDRVGEVWRVDYASLADAAVGWRQEHGIAPARDDRPRVCLLLVDVQNTFCIPGYELFVAGRSGTGAVDDNSRLCRFIYRNLASITEIQATMDTHSPHQIFHPAFWTDGDGKHPAPMTTISVADVEKGRWRVADGVAAELDREPAELDAYARYYVRRLAAAEKYDLMIWPYHAILGGPSHALVSSVHEAVFFHSLVRRARGPLQVKGARALTEHYSALRPEVLTDHEGRPIAEENEEFVETLLDFDVVAVAGQAKSHCLAWTIDDLLGEISERDPSLAKKVYLLEDCTSPVVVEGVADFTDAADAAFQRFADAGMHLVTADQPISSWP